MNPQEIFMKKIIIALVLSSVSAVTFANSRAYDLANEAQSKIQSEREAKESWESRMSEIVHRAALMTDVKINCSSSGQEKIQNLISDFNGELKAEYESIFSCEGAIEKALDGGISESEIRKELGL